MLSSIKAVFIPTDRPEDDALGTVCRQKTPRKIQGSIHPVSEDFAIVIPVLVIDIALVPILSIHYILVMLALASVPGWKKRSEISFVGLLQAMGIGRSHSRGQSPNNGVREYPARK
jgi:hypothetical protein